MHCAKLSSLGLVERMEGHSEAGRFILTLLSSPMLGNGAKLNWLNCEQGLSIADVAIQHCGLASIIPIPPETSVLD
jgi:hypothetical protein